MQEKMFVLDLDDTLLRSDKTISKSTIKELKKLDALGHKIILASGRPFRAMDNYYHLLGLTTPIVTDNGGCLFNPTDKAFQRISKTIPRPLFNKLFKDTIDMIKEAFYSVDQYIYTYNRSGRLEFLYHADESSIMLDGRFDKMKNVHDPYGVLFVIGSENREEFEKYFKNLCNEIVVRTLGYDLKNAIYEVYNRDVNKSQMIDYLAKYYHLTKKDIYCFGDGLNDVEMLKYAQGIAMKNASEEVKKSALEVTKYDCNHNGVIRHIKIILKRNKKLSR